MPMSMRHIARRTLASASLLAVLAAPALAADPAAPSPRPRQLPPAVDAVKTLPRVIDAQLDSRGALYVVSKYDPKVKWPDYAAYICNGLASYPERIFTVRMIDVTAVRPSQPPEDWKRMAEARCAGKK